MYSTKEREMLNYIIPLKWHLYWVNTGRKKKIYTALVSYILYYLATSKHSLKLDMIKSDLFI